MARWSWCCGAATYRHKALRSTCWRQNISADECALLVVMIHDALFEARRCFSDSQILMFSFLLLDTNVGTKMCSWRFLQNKDVSMFFIYIHARLGAPLPSRWLQIAQRCELCSPSCLALFAFWSLVTATLTSTPTTPTGTTTTVHRHNHNTHSSNTAALPQRRT